MQVDVVVRTGETAELVDRLSRRLADGRPQLLSLVDRLIAAERLRFMGVGQRWRRLAPATVRKDRQEGRNPQPMIVTGALLRSLTQVGDRDQIVRVRPGQLQFGTRVFYARFHQRGEGVPKRTVAGLTRQQRKGVVEDLRRLLLEDT